MRGTRFIKALKSWFPRHEPVPHKVTTRSQCDDFLAALYSSAKRRFVDELAAMDALGDLLRVFAKHDIRAELLGYKWWEEFLWSSTHTDEASSSSQQRMIEKIRQLPVDELEHWELLHVYSLTLRVGLFNVGCALRAKARERAIETYKSEEKLDRRNLTAAFAAFMEVGRYEDANEAAEKVKAIYSYDEQFYVLLFLWSLMKEESVGHDMRGRARLMECADQKFEDFINGKEICLIGPAISRDEVAEDIDAFDVVVRLNYRKKEVGLDDAVRGSRCDVTYLAAKVSEDIWTSYQNAVNWPFDVKWVICNGKRKQTQTFTEGMKYWMGNETVKQIAEGKGINVRSYYSQGLYFNGRLNIFPRVLLDLLQFGPARLKIFHADLNVSPQRYWGYADAYDVSDSKLCEMMLADLYHCDAYTNYWVINTLWRLNYIEGEERFNTVMTLGPERYMEKLQEVYGGQGRIRLDCQK